MATPGGAAGALSAGRRGARKSGEFVTLAAIREARAVIADVVRRTPLVPLGAADGVELYGKCENLQRTGSFKIRGACNRIARLPAGIPGVVAYSSGNHAMAVALAARTRGLKALVVMPRTSVVRKVEGARALGAEVLLTGTTSEDVRRRAEREVARRGFVLVHPFDDFHVIAGQGTVGAEILEQLPGLKSVVVAVGGGGLASGVAAALKESRPGIKVFGVQARGAAGMLRSLRAGRPVDLERADTVADGLKALRPGVLTFAHLRRYLDDIIDVGDDEILEAARDLLLREQLVVEPSGAAARAAVRSGRLDLPAGPIVVVLSGGNADLRMILDGKAGRP